MNKKVKIEIIRTCLIGGEAQGVGQVCEVDIFVANQLIGMARAIEYKQKAEKKSKPVIDIGEENKAVGLPKSESKLFKKKRKK